MSHNSSTTGELDVNGQTALVQVTTRPLTQEELDRRIGDVASSILAAKARRAPKTAELRPFWISPAELVRRMKPFIVLN